LSDRPTPSFDFQHAFGSEAIDVHVEALLLRVALAACLGAVIAFRPWRRLFRGVRPPSAQAAQSQTLIAAAGALMVMVIGESVARAFGLVGLGSFIRFRSGIRDPRDAALLFVMIGIGMACGLGLPYMAAAGAGFVTALLIVFDRSARQRVTVTIDAPQPNQALVALRRRFMQVRTLELEQPGLPEEQGRLVVELDLGRGADAASLGELLVEEGVMGVSRVELGD